MLLAYFRLGFVLTAFVASLYVAAAPRFWTLSGVKFNDGAIASGYFSYDDATQTVENWSVRVTEGWATGYPAEALTVGGFTYVPGNSVVYQTQAPSAGHRGFSFAAGLVPGPYVVSRGIQINPEAALDGSNTTASLITRAPDSRNVSMESFTDYDADGFQIRLITAGSLSLMPLPPPVAVVQVDEFYSPTLRHYFITASAAEKTHLDTGGHLGWVRTGESFKAFATGSLPGGTVNPVCRFYGNPRHGLDSHFYSADAVECVKLFHQNPVYWRSEIDEEFHTDWVFESDNAFQINLPNRTSGNCPGGTLPVYRLWNRRADSSHRYTTSATIKAEMVAVGYVAEGYGPDGVAMCAVQ